MKRLQLATALLFSLVILCAAQEAPKESAAPEENAAEMRPLIVMHRTEGNMRDGRNEGLRLAIWKDGKVLFSPLPDQLGYAMLLGQIDPEAVRELERAFEASGLLSHPRAHYVVPDATYSTLSVDGLGSRSWHEYLNPGFGGNIDEDEEYFAFVKAWKHCTSALEALVPRQLQRLDENVREPSGVFRDYSSAEPDKTPWLPGLSGDLHR